MIPSQKSRRPDSWIWTLCYKGTVSKLHNVNFQIVDNKWTFTPFFLVSFLHDVVKNYGEALGTDK